MGTRKLPTMENVALRYHRHGPAQEVLQKESPAWPKMRAGEVLLRMLASPINPSDIGSITGSYGELPSLPAVAGREGVAEVVEAPEADRLRPGQRVLLPEGIGAWCSVLAAKADELLPVPETVPVEQAAMAAINPLTALLLLRSFVELKPGEWIIQNAANSAVGHYIIELCRARGIHSINLVRDLKWREPLQSAGGEAVLLDDPDVPKQVERRTGGQRPRLALNSVGGNSAIGLVKCLADGGTMVTFGGMTGEAVRFPTRYLIFNDVRLAGFWVHRWKKQHSAQERRELMAEVLDFMAAGVLHAPVERTYPLEEFSEALEHASAPGRRGKILFRGSSG